MIIHEQITPGKYGQAPTFRVECPECGYKYVVTSWHKQILKQKRCWTCGRKRYSLTRTSKGRFAKNE